MGIFRNLTLRAGALAAASLACSAQAQVVGKTTCGLATQNVVATFYYDPFNPVPISNQTVTLPLNRFVKTEHGAAKTQQVNFYFTQPTGSPNFVITSSAAPGVSNLLYNQSTPGVGGGAPTLDETSQINGALNINFGGAAQPDIISLPVNISIPPGLDLWYGLTVSFGIVYQCKGTGGLSSEDTNVYLANAILMPVKVLSALQANYAGPAMDFGDVKQAGATGHPFANFQAPISGPGEINVRSSGPYDVTLTSANNFTMVNGAGGPANSIQYKLHFLGQDLTPNSTFSATHSGDPQRGGQHQDGGRL